MKYEVMLIVTEKQQQQNTKTLVVKRTQSCNFEPRVIFSLQSLSQMCACVYAHARN